MTRFSLLYIVVMVLVLPPARSTAQDTGPIMLESEDWWTIAHPAKDGQGPTVSVMADSVDLIVTEAGWEVRPTLTLACREGSLSVSVFAAGITFMDVREYGVVGISFPDKMPFGLPMAADGQDSSLGLQSTDAAEFIDNLLASTEVTFNIRVPNEQNALFRFNLVGLADVIGPLKEACPW
jgi:hypothetical protein